MILKVEDLITSWASPEKEQWVVQSLDSKFDRVGNSWAWITKDRIRSIVSDIINTNNTIQ